MHSTVTATNTPPVLAVADHSLAINQSAAMAPWLSYFDADGDAAVAYQIIRLWWATLDAEWRKSAC